MTKDPIHGHATTGQPITDAEVEKYAAEAEAGYDVDELLSRRSKRASLGSPG